MIVEIAWFNFKLSRIGQSLRATVTHWQSRWLAPQLELESDLKTFKFKLGTRFLRVWCSWPQKLEHHRATSSAAVDTVQGESSKFQYYRPPVSKTVCTWSTSKWMVFPSLSLIIEPLPVPVAPCQILVLVYWWVYFWTWKLSIHWEHIFVSAHVENFLCRYQPLPYQWL